MWSSKVFSSGSWEWDSYDCSDAESFGNVSVGPEEDSEISR